MCFAQLVRSITDRPSQHPASHISDRRRLWGYLDRRMMSWGSPTAIHSIVFQLQPGAFEYRAKSMFSFVNTFDINDADRACMHITEIVVGRICCLYVCSSPAFEQCLFVYTLVYEFHYQGPLFKRKCYVCKQFMNVRNLYMNQHFKIWASEDENDKKIHIFRH